MLKAAQIYEKELQEKNIESWYKPENIFWSGYHGNGRIDIPENNYDKHCFVSVDRRGEVIGYMSYYIDWTAMSVYDFGAISFKNGKIEFAKDLYNAVCNCFKKYHMNRISWWCFADNPSIRGYRNFIKCHGGRECGYHRQIAKLQDGRLHDSVDFEILADEFM